MFMGNVRAVFAAGALITGMCAIPASADACGKQLRVTFTEDTPDNFKIEFLDGAGLQLTSVHFDLRPSAGGAYVDTVFGNAAPSASQSVVLRSIEGFADGGQTGTVKFKTFPPKQSFTLEIDLDDSSPVHDYDPSHLTNGELLGAKVEAVLVEANGKTHKLTGKFNARGIAELGNRACV